MKKNRNLNLFCILLFVVSFSLAACGQNEPDEVPLGETNKAPDVVIENIPEEPVEEPELEGLPVISERQTVDGKMQSYLTGEWKDEKVVKRRPLAVMIPNNAPAMPQYGISKASIIYEAPVEGRITRLMAMFEDYDDLDHIGPIRSSRDYFVYTAMGYEAIYVNWGLARPYVEELINRDTVQNISAAVEGIHNPSDEAFGRIKRPGYATEFTGYLFIDGLNKAIERHKYETEYDKDYVPQFTFIADDNRSEYADNENATEIYPGGKERNKGGYGVYNPYFKYDDTDKLYYRFQDGKEQIDELDNKQLAVSNVVFQYCHGEVRDAKDYLAFGVHGEGKAIVFTNGKVINGTWKRYDGDATPAKYYDENDEEIIFNQGKTWICNIWKEFSDSVEYR